MKTLLIIPAFNEEESIVNLLQELRGFPQYDIIVINDCSSDQTEELVREQDVRCISLPINLGLSGAVQTGLKYGREKNYDICVQIDGDGQHVPREIEKLIEEIRNGADIVIGSRFLGEKVRYEQTLFRKLGAQHITLMIWLFSGLKLTDPTSGMRAYNKTVFYEIAEATNERPEPDTMLFFARRGFKIQEVNVEMRERQGGESYLTPWKAVKYMIENTLSFIYVFLRTKKETN
ncbi:MAG: glycosyltransferase family 2 protein [Culicoidibacterales bacterium]